VIPAQLIEALHKAQRVLVTSHVKPDGDAVASLLGMGEMLRALGKDVTVALQDSPPYELMRIPLVETIRSPQQARGAYDTLVSVDASTPDRFGIVPEFITSPYTLVVIDHHVTNAGFGDVNWVGPENAATCEMLVSLADALGVVITPPMAQILLTGLVTDTLCFRTGSTTSQTLAAGMRLLAVGADLTEITENILDQRSFPVIQLWSDVLDDARLEDGVLWVTLRRAQMAAVGLKDGEDGSLSSLLIRTIGADISATFLEKLGKKGEPAVECSFRARAGFNISGVANTLGGGGHPAAGGVSVSGTLEEAVARIVPMLKDVRVQQRQLAGAA